MMETMKSRGLDSWQSWRIAFSCGLIFMLSSFSMASMGSIFTGLIEDFQSERERASLPLTAITCSMQIISPVFSVLVHFKVSHKLILRLCTFSMAATLLLCHFATKIYPLTALLAVHGASLAGIFMSANVLMAGHFLKQRSAASAMQESLAGLSVFFMPALMSLSIAKFRTSTSLSILGALVSLAAVLSFLVFPFEAPKEETIEDPEEEPDCHQDTPLQGTSEEPEDSPWSFLLQPLFYLDVFSFMVVFECYSSFLQLTGDYSRDVDVPQASNWLVPAFGIGDLILKLGAGFLSSKGTISPSALMVFGGLLQCGGFVALTYSNSFITLLGSSALIGASTGCRIFLFIIVLINDFGLKKLSHTFSFSNLIIGLVSLVKPKLVGYFRDRLGRYLGLFLLLGGLNVITALYWAIRLYRSRRKGARSENDETQ